MTTLSDLTSRELEILQLLLAGYTNRAIAAEISISEIGVRTRLAAVWAIQQGIAETRGIPS
jgi:DNA-binding NarL/FixJ family response regulator